MKCVVRWVVCVLALMYVPAPDAGARELTMGRTLAGTSQLAPDGSAASDHAFVGGAMRSGRRTECRRFRRCMTKTLVGFAVGVLSAQFNLATMVPRLVMFVAATFVHDLIFLGLQAIAGARPFSFKWSAVLLQALVNALIGSSMFFFVEHGPQMVANRRMRRASLSKRRF